MFYVWFRWQCSTYEDYDMETDDSPSNLADFEESTKPFWAK